MLRQNLFAQGSFDSLAYSLIIKDLLSLCNFLNGQFFTDNHRV